jgi:hypothetical protein
MEANFSVEGAGVRALAKVDGRGGGYFWIVDGNERDRYANLACDGVAAHLTGVDVMTADLGTTISEIDTDVLPALGREKKLSGLAISLMIGRVTSKHVTVAHVGESRAYLLAEDGAVRFVSREHNVYNLYPESAWKNQLRYTADQAKGTILNVVGGGVAYAESRIGPRPTSGALVALSHLAHGYRDVDEHLGAASALAKAPTLALPVSPSAITLVRW